MYEILGNNIDYTTNESQVARKCDSQRKGGEGGGGICPPTPEYILRIAIAGERRISRSKLVYPVSFVHAIHANGSVL